jgi:hypothetical protein
MILMQDVMIENTVLKEENCKLKEKNSYLEDKIKEVIKSKLSILKKGDTL